MSWKSDIAVLGGLAVGGYVVFMNAPKIASWIGDMLFPASPASVAAAASFVAPPIGGGSVAAGFGAPTDGGAIIPTPPTSPADILIQPPFGGYSPNIGNQPNQSIWAGSPALPAGTSISEAIESNNLAPIIQPVGGTSAALEGVPSNITGTASHFDPSSSTPWAQPGSPAWNAAHGL